MHVSVREIVVQTTLYHPSLLPLCPLQSTHRHLGILRSAHKLANIHPKISLVLYHVTSHCNRSLYCCRICPYGNYSPSSEYPYGDAAIADWNATAEATPAHPRITMEFYFIRNDNLEPFAITTLTEKDDNTTFTWVASFRTRSRLSQIGSATIVVLPSTQRKSLPHPGPVVLNPITFAQSGSELLFDAADDIMDIEVCHSDRGTCRLQRLCPRPILDAGKAIRDGSGSGKSLQE